MKNTIEQLKTHFPRTGQIEWIGVREARGQPMQLLEEVLAQAGTGLQGDKAGARPGGKRQVTFIQAEYLSLIQALLCQPTLSFADLRRNIAVSGINLNALKDQIIQVGSARFEVTGFCHPCKKLEESLGYGTFNALRGHGGITAKVIQGGKVVLGDSLQVISE
jgi:MOSC domain-containing protein YiiM